MASSQPLVNGHTNGVNGIHNDHRYDSYTRFSDIPAVIDIPVRGEDGEEAVNLDLTELLDETDELCDLLENENAARNYWITIALAYAKQKKVDVAIDILGKGLQALSRGSGGAAAGDDRLRMLTCLCWLYLCKCRRAPRVKPTQVSGNGEDERTKDHFLHLGTQTLNEASRISPSYPPLFLARGTLYLLRASLQPSKGSQEHSERAETLKQAVKSFDDALRVSNGKNVMAMLGKAKAHFSLNNTQQALLLYQQALERAPHLTDPDPRIGIGCCLWQLGHKEQARFAWQRSLDLNSDSIIANILLGLYYLDQSAQYTPSDPAFAPTYKKAMTLHTQTAFKLDAMHALTCATFGSYFLLRKTWANVERLARRAIECTDVNAVASDGWFLLGRKEHFQGDLVKAGEHYVKADQARGGDERGYLPAKFGAAQLSVHQQDFDGAKFRLEKIVEKSNPRSLEAMTLLGALHAEEVFGHGGAGAKTADEIAGEAKKAVAILEQVRNAWKDPKRKASPDRAVLLTLARLYETDQPEKALACLSQVEQMELDAISEDDLPDEVGDEVEERRARRELLSPQLLNNLGCFHFQADKFAEAREDFQTALSACVKIGERMQLDGEDGDTPDFDTDALVSTISYNLARTYEAENITPEAQKIYQGLLDRHPDYIDANTRLTYLTLQEQSDDPTSAADTLKTLLDSHPSNLEVRALYGWHLNRTKKRTPNLNEDPEQRHYKQTLQTHDKHDLYSLVGMGNLHLVVAREMPRDTDVHRDRRSKTYMRAVEFFDKVLALDPKNAYAAQGVGIATVEELRDAAGAIQIFSKVRESVGGDGGVCVNLGHVFTEVKQFTRAIESYEIALAKLSGSSSASGPGKDRQAQIMTYLGRAHFSRGRAEKKLEAYKTALEFSLRALAIAPENPSYNFNVAFVRMQLAQMIITLPDSAKTLVEVEAAAAGLDEATEAFGAIARGPNPPFPRGDLEQRANMGRNTMKRQLAAAVEKQGEYERRNADKLESARKAREAGIARREEERRAAEALQEAERARLRTEREALAQQDRELVERRMEEEKAREAAEWTTDAETGERKKREKKPKVKGAGKRRKKGDETEGEAGEGRAGSASGSDADAAPSGRRKKKRKLESRKSARASKYKSKDIVEDSSEEDEPAAGVSAAEANGTEEDEGMADLPADDEEEPAASTVQQRRKVARVLDDDEDEEDDQDGTAQTGVAEAGDSDHGGDPL